MKSPLMIKWRYWNNSTAKAGRASNYLNYIGTRDGVEKLSEEKIKEFEKALDEWLNESNEKYFKYRRWGMIGEPKLAILKDNTYDDYRDYLKKQGKVLNQIKPVTVINTPEREEFFLSHIAE